MTFRPFRLHLVRHRLTVAMVLSILVAPCIVLAQEGPAIYLWRGEPVPGEGVLSGPWTGSGDAGDWSQLQGRKEFTVVDPETGEFTVEFFAPQDGDSIDFTGAEILFRPVGGKKNITLATYPILDTTTFGLRNADFSGGEINAVTVIISNQLLNLSLVEGMPNQMTFSNTAFSADEITLSAGEFQEAIDDDVDLTFLGGALRADVGMKIGASFASPVHNPQSLATGEIRMEGMQLSAATLTVNNIIETANFSELVWGLKNVSGTVAGDVLLSYDDTSNVKLIIEGSQSSLDWGATSGVTQLGVFGDAEIIVKDDAHWDTNSTFLALANSSQVSVDVRDASWNANDLGIGGQGRAEVKLSGDAELTSGDSFMATFANDIFSSSVSLEDAAKWVVNGFLEVGRLGSARIDVKDQSTLDVNGQIVIATSEGSSGEVHIQSSNTFDVETTLEVGRDGMGKLHVSDGGVTKSGGDFYIGTFSKGSGEVVVEGVGSRLELSGNLNIGNGSSVIPGSGSNGVGTLLIADGAELKLGEGSEEIRIGRREGSEGALTFRGSDSKFTLETTQAPELVAGVDGTGTLKIEDGFQLENDQLYITLGEFEKGRGTLELVGENSLLSVKEAYIGEEGFGEMVVHGGAKAVASDSVYVGLTNTNTESKLTIDGADSRFEIGKDLIVGDLGKGLLTLKNGATIEVNGDEIILGKQQGSEGTLRLDGSGEDATRIQGTAQLVIGQNGKGKLEVVQGATFAADQLDIASTEQISSGSLLVEDVFSKVMVKNSYVFRRGESVISKGAKVETGTSGSGKSILGEEQNDEALQTITGEGSKWTVHTDLIIGERGKGEVVVDDQGELEVKKMLVLGGEVRGKGKLTIDGNDSLAFPSRVFYKDLRVGQRGSGEILIKDGAELRGSGTDNPIYLGYGSTSPIPTKGMVTVEGDGAIWEVGSSAGLYIGDLGKGEVTVGSGGVIWFKPESTLSLGESGGGDSEGSLTIRGRGSVFASQVITGNLVSIGRQGTANLRIEDGGRLVTNDFDALQTNIATGQLSNALIEVTGEGSNFWTGAMTVGGADGGAFSIKVSDKGLMRTKTATITGSSGNSAIIEVESARWQAERINLRGESSILINGESANLGLSGGALGISLDVGGSREVETRLSVSHSAQVNYGTESMSWMRFREGSRLELSDGAVVAATRFVMAPTVDIGANDGKARLQATNQSEVIVNGDSLFGTSEATFSGDSALETKGLSIGVEGGAVSTMVFDASRLFAHDVRLGGAIGVGHVTLANNSTADIGSELNISNGEWDTTGGATTVGGSLIKASLGQVRVNPSGKVSGDGTLHGDLYLGGGVDEFTGMLTGGRLEPGNSPGSLTVMGGFFAEAGAQLVLEIAGTSSGQFDQLLVDGFAEFTPGSTIELLFTDGFAPQTGESFSFVQATGGLEMDFNDLDFTVRGLMPGFEYMSVVSNGAFSIVALNDGVAVPEPSTAILILGTVACLGIAGRTDRRPSSRPAA